MNVTHLYCSACSNQYEPHRLYNLCDCGKPLMVAYDLNRAQKTFTRESLVSRAPTLWRYAEVLPVDDPNDRIRLIRMSGSYCSIRDRDSNIWMSLKGERLASLQLR